MAEPTPRRNEPRLRPAPLLFEPTQVADDPEHFFDLESIEDPRALLTRATELTHAMRAATPPPVVYHANAAAQQAHPRPLHRLTTASIAERAEWTEDYAKKMVEFGQDLLRGTEGNGHGHGVTDPL